MIPRAIIVMLALILAPVIASAGSSYDVRDGNGRTVERIVPNGDGSYDVRDLNGRHVQTIAPSFPGSRDLNVRDRNGRTVKTIRPADPEPVEEGEEGNE